MISSHGSHWPKRVFCFVFIDKQNNLQSGRDLLQFHLKGSSSTFFDKMWRAFRQYVWPKPDRNASQCKTFTGEDSGEAKIFIFQPSPEWWRLFLFLRQFQPRTAGKGNPREMELLLAPQNLPFGIALGLVVVLAALQVFMLLLGGPIGIGGGGGDLDVDVDAAEFEGGPLIAALDWLGVGKVPLGILFSLWAAGGTPP